MRRLIVLTFVVVFAMSFVVADDAVKAEQQAPAPQVEMIDGLEVLPCAEEYIDIAALLKDEKDNGMSEAKGGPSIGDSRPPKLGCTAKDCSDYPMGIFDTCSCSSTLLNEKCYRTCDRKKGQIVETTCTICPGCASPPCIPQPCNNRTSRHCIPR